MFIFKVNRQVIINIINFFLLIVCLCLHFVHAYNIRFTGDKHVSHDIHILSNSSKVTHSKKMPNYRFSNSSTTVLSGIQKDLRLACLNNNGQILKNQKVALSVTDIKSRTNGGITVSPRTASCDKNGIARAQITNSVGGTAILTITSDKNRRKIMPPSKDKFEFVDLIKKGIKYKQNKRYYYFSVQVKKNGQNTKGVKINWSIHLVVNNYAIPKTSFTNSDGTATVELLDYESIASVEAITPDNYRVVQNKEDIREDTLDSQSDFAGYSVQLKTPKRAPVNSNVSVSVEMHIYNANSGYKIEWQLDPALTKISSTDSMSTQGTATITFKSTTTGPHTIGFLLYNKCGKVSMAYQKKITFY